MVEVEWSETACDRAPSLDGGSIWIQLLAFGMWHELRPGRATRGKWRITDGTVGEWIVFMFGALKVVALSYVY
jgi:hypothetical protein